MAVAPETAVSIMAGLSPARRALYEDI